MPLIGTFGAGAARGFGQRQGGSSPFIEACGGTKSTDGNYTIHTFTSSGSLCVSKLACCAADNVISYMVVAGGGGGGDGRGGGAGAGGFREYKSPVDTYTASPLDGNPGGTSITIGCTGAIPVTIGAGGVGYSAPTRQGQRGGNTIFSNVTSTGGGGGGGGGPPPSTAGMPGGSGGGGGGEGLTGGGNGNEPPVAPPQGQNGGPASGPNATKGGGGGASETGGTQPGPSFRSANGGDGVPTGINPSTCVGTPGPAPGRWFAGGGESCGNPSGYGGFGGGGGSTPMSGDSPAFAGKANTGGGGGGRSTTGGSGIVIIRYKSA